jgi:hypothetical protein
MKLRARHLPTCVAALALLMALPAGASASKPTTKAKTKASIKAALNSYDAQLEAVHARVVTAVDAYTTSTDVGAVQAAISEELTVLRDIRTTVKAVSTAGHPLIHYGKTLVVEGLKGWITSDEHLSKMFADTATNKPKAAKREFAHARLAIKRGLREIHRGVRLV